MPVRKLLIRNLLFLGITGGLGAVGIALNLNLPGAGFGTCGEGFIRISAFNSRDNVTAAMARIRQALS